MVTSKTRLIFIENSLIIFQWASKVMTVRWYVYNLRHYFLSLFLELSLNIVNLKELRNLFTDTEILQIPVTELARTLAPSFKNLPGSLLMPAALWCQYLIKV